MTRRQLKRLLSYREQIEEREQLALATRVLERNAARDRLAEQEAGMRAHEALVVDVQSKPTPAEELLRHYLYLERLRREWTARKEALLESERRVDEQRRRLLDAHRQKKAMETLLQREDERARPRVRDEDRMLARFDDVERRLVAAVRGVASEGEETSPLRLAS